MRITLLSLGLWILSLPLLGQDFPPDQPYASFWFPNDLLTWSPATDPDAPFNRSNVPLATRSADAATQVNSHARGGEGKVASLAVMFPTTSFNPSQGARRFDTYAFGYWGYVDVQVFFGGSAGEGLILAPNPGIIDAAHRNGVPVYGNIFFPPNAFGGNIQWVRDLVQRDMSGDFPVGDKLIEVAEHYGFDGWFINQETSGGNAALATDVRDFMRYVLANSDLEFQWYDAMVENGPVVYQNALTGANDAFLEEMSKVSDSMFLNYFWNITRLNNSVNLANVLGRSPYDLYAGINVGINGFNTFVNWNGPFPEGVAHRTSLGIFAPQWSLDNASGDVPTFYANDNHLWVGPNGDPSNTSTPDTWKGIAHYVPAKTPINTLPFVTNFNTGQGQRYAIDGDILGAEPWNNLGLQDVLPTWRWIVTSLSPELVPSLDFDDSYDGGSSLRVQGNLAVPHQFDLFKTHLDIAADTNLEIVYKTGTAGTPSNLEVGVASLTAEGCGPFQYFSAGATATDGWNRVVFDLSGLSGDTVGVIALRFSAAGTVPDYDIRIGRMALYNGAVDVPSPPSAVTILSKDEVDPATATLRLQWTHSPDPVYAYHVYRRNPDSSRTHLGGTANNAYFAYAVRRVGGETTTTIEVEAVGLEYGRSTVATTTFDWDVPLFFFDGFESESTSAWSVTVE